MSIKDTEIEVNGQVVMTNKHHECPICNRIISKRKIKKVFRCVICDERCSKGSRKYCPFHRLEINRLRKQKSNQKYYEKKKEQKQKIKEIIKHHEEKSKPKPIDYSRFKKKQKGKKIISSKSFGDLFIDFE